MPKILEKWFKIVIGVKLEIKALLPFLKTGMTAACFHRVGNNSIQFMFISVQT
jgi:hypothetical protein